MSQISKDLLKLCNEIQTEIDLVDRHIDVPFSLFPQNLAVENLQQAVSAQEEVDYKTKLLDKLARNKILTYEKNPDAIDGYESAFLLNVDVDKLNSFSNELNSTTEHSPNTTDAPNNALILDSNGDLWMYPKEQFCYSMKSSSGRLKLFKFLVDNPDFQSTKLVADHTGKTAKGVRSEIYKINQKAGVYININDLIESSPNGIGYRVNPKYNIKLSA